VSISAEEGNRDHNFRGKPTAKPEAEEKHKEPVALAGNLNGETIVRYSEARSRRNYAHFVLAPPNGTTVQRRAASESELAGRCNREFGGAHRSADYRGGGSMIGPSGVNEE
jgi:hypothetical protein